MNLARQAHIAAAEAHEKAANLWAEYYAALNVPDADWDAAEALTVGSSAATFATKALSQYAQKLGFDRKAQEAARKAYRQDGPSDEARIDHTAAAKAHREAAEKF